ncbi:MAG TPA: PIN domain-containing protein [Kofleriaceae bacterium]|nr:PIN domain-containing protein [Kofleriaceae bacterium]
MRRRSWEIVLALRAAGTPVPTNDIWIAAVAAREGVHVVTYDAHFASIARVGTHVLSRNDE